MKNVVFVILLLILIAGGIFVGVKFYRRQKMMSLYKSDNNISTINNETSSPNAAATSITLTITSPTEGQSVNTPALSVVGTTIPNAEVSVNEIDTMADQSGRFNATVNLDEGDNTISVVANDANGNFVEKDINVTYNVAQ